MKTRIRRPVFARRTRRQQHRQQHRDGDHGVNSERAWQCQHRATLSRSPSREDACRREAPVAQRRHRLHRGYKSRCFVQPAGPFPSLCAPANKHALLCKVQSAEGS